MDGGQLASVREITQVSTNSYAAMAGTKLATLGCKQGTVAYLLSVPDDTPAYGLTFKLQASIDNAAWVDIPAYGADGVEAAEFAVAAGAIGNALVTPSLDNGVQSAYRFYRVAVKSTTSNQPNEAVVTGEAK